MKKIQAITRDTIYDLTLALQNIGATKEDVIIIFQNKNSEYIAVYYK